MKALRSGSFPYGNGLRNAEGGSLGFWGRVRGVWVIEFPFLLRGDFSLVRGIVGGPLNLEKQRVRRGEMG